jgi:hypothetical protein
MDIYVIILCLVLTSSASFLFYFCISLYEKGIEDKQRINCSFSFFCCGLKVIRKYPCSLWLYYLIFMNCIIWLMFLVLIIF